ncbi:hypothetical protein Mgra_00005562 [Meloidogyne graminicola]|uniref:Uncharacterized protein n=1 Tax=Meloidogyne graminicola TaxID=189291 RepID=A0A8S9ZP30_9BILA|nr:hypothetical protein Mgra_00005562 [Meloidogyne graminicola]
MELFNIRIILFKFILEAINALKNSDWEKLEKIRQNAITLNKRTKQISTIITTIKLMFNEANKQTQNLSFVSEKTKKEIKNKIINRTLENIVDTQLFSLFSNKFLDEGWARRLALKRGNNIDLELFTNKKI